MLPYKQTSASIDVWQTDPPSATIADIAFAPLSTENIELTNDYEPVAYQANRKLRAAQAASELSALQERNHSTTAYATLGCVAQPLFPTFDAQRAVRCEEQQAARVGDPTVAREQALVARASSGTNTCKCGKVNKQGYQHCSNCIAPPIGYDPGYYITRQGMRACVPKKKKDSCTYYKI